jgi:hypothetical protein
VSAYDGFDGGRYASDPAYAGRICRYGVPYGAVNVPAGSAVPAGAVLQPAPPPIPIGDLVDTVRQRLADAREERSRLDAEIATLEAMLTAAGERAADIARRFGVSFWAASRAISGRTWAHV